MRESAWGALFGGGWFLRLLVVTVLFAAINQAVGLAYSSACEWCGARTIQDYRFDRKFAKICGEDEPAPITKEELPVMLAASALEMALSLLLAGIAALGVQRTQLKAARRDGGPDWVKSSMQGFRQPLSLLWLSTRLFLQVFGWTLLFVIPGIVAAYRYALAWFLKSDNPDWSAGRCIAESKRLMRGRKWRAFVFDCSYWKIVGLLLLSLMAFMSAAAALFLLVPTLVKVLMGVISFGVFLVMLGLSIVVNFYWGVGRAIFYCEILEEESAPLEVPAEI